MDDEDLLLNTPRWDWPGGAAASIVRVLRNPSAAPTDRLAAAEYAGDLVVMNDELADALLGILCDGSESDELRGAAAIALGPVLEIGDTEGFDDVDPDADMPITEATYDRIRSTLHELYRDGAVPKLVRRRVLEASVRAPEEWQAAAIRAAYHDGDPEWRLTAVFCMRFLPGFDDEVIDALRTGTDSLRWEAVVAAGERCVRDAWPYVVDLVRRERSNRDLLFAAIGAAPLIHPDEAEALLAELAELGDPEIDEVVFEALAMAGLGFLDDEEPEF